MCTKIDEEPDLTEVCAIRDHLRHFEPDLTEVCAIGDHLRQRTGVESRAVSTYIKNPPDGSNNFYTTI